MIRVSLLFFALSCMAVEVYSQDYSAVDDKAEGVAFTRDYLAAANALAEPYSSDKLKLRAIFTWIVSNIEYDMKPLQQFQETGKRTKTVINAKSQEELDAQIRSYETDRIEETLRRRKGVCMDYALLLKHMCEAIGIDARYISGFGRFNHTIIGNKHGGPNHAWNAVLIDGKWELLDATWSTGMGMEQSYTEGYFMVDPGIFIHTHHPDSAEWQLLEEPVDIPEFADLAFMHRGFLEHSGVDFQPRQAYLSKRDENTLLIAFKKTLPGKIVMMEGNEPVFPDVVKSGNSYTIAYTPKRAIPRLVSLAVLIDNGRIEPLVTYKTR